MTLHKCKPNFTPTLQGQRTLCLFLLCLTISGCVSSALDKSVSRAIAIEERCTTIQQAVPVESQKLKAALFDAVAQRLVGTCLEGDQVCLNAPGQVQTPQDVVLVAGNLQSQMRKRIDVLKLGMQSNNALTSEATALKQSYGLALDEIEARRTAVSIRRDALLAALRNARDALKVEQSDQLQLCAQRTDCITRFATLLREHETTLRDRGRELQASVALLADSGKLLQSLEAPTAKLLAAAEARKDNVLLQLTEEKNNLSKDGAALVTASLQLGTRLVNGAEVLQRLFSGDVERAATDLMAAKLYGKAAERSLVLIDGMLAQLDHTIDKMDDHLYGGATLVVQLYSGEMQERFDRIIKQLVAEKFKSKTAKLAFADAACQRLGIGAAPATQNKSIFSPFVYATLVNLQLDLADPLAKDYSPKERARKLEERRKADDDVNASLAAVQNIREELATKAADAFRDDAKLDVAPSMLQQVAMCATVEQQLSSAAPGKVGDVQAEASKVCAHAAMAAAKDNAPIKEPVSAAAAQSAIVAAVKDNAMPVANDVMAASAWSAAMEKVIASIPKPPSVKEDQLCTRIVARMAGARCEEVQGKLMLDFDKGFAKGKASDRTLELNLAKLADVLNAQPRYYQLSIEGHASRSAPACRKDVASAAQSCGESKNQQLALDRANWAVGVLRRRLASGADLAIVSSAANNPLSFDTPADRRIRVSIWPAAQGQPAVPIASRQ